MTEIRLIANLSGKLGEDAILRDAVSGSFRPLRLRLLGGGFLHVSNLHYQREDHQRDTDEGVSKAAPAKSKFFKSAISALVGGLGNLQRRARDCRNRIRAESVDGNASFDELGIRLLQIEFWFADLHAGAFGSGENLGCGVDLQPQTEDGSLHDVYFRSGVFAYRVTGHTNAGVLCAQHSVIGLMNFVVIVTHHTCRQSHRLKRGLVGTLAK